MVCGIYEIRNLVNNKFYIGGAAVIKVRWGHHRTMLRGNYHDNPHLQRAWNNCGEENFEFNILFLCALQDLERCEQIFMNIRKPAYNMCPVAGNTRGLKLTEEHKQKIGLARMGHKVTEETRQRLRLALTGHKHSEETKRKMSKAQLAREPFSEETRRKMSLANVGKHQGENHHMAKLSEGDVHEIRRLYATGKVTQHILGEMFKITQSQIGYIVSRKRWTHI